jgi:hypothetical protein
MTNKHMIEVNTVLSRCIDQNQQLQLTIFCANQRGLIGRTIFETGIFVTALMVSASIICHSQRIGCDSQYNYLKVYNKYYTT